MTDAPGAAARARQAPFWEAATRGELVGQRCAACGVLRIRRGRCARIASREARMGPALRAGQGRGAGCGPASRADPTFDYPLVCVLVDLDEGIRLVSNLCGCDPGGDRNGLEVAVGFVPPPATT